MHARMFVNIYGCMSVDYACTTVCMPVRTYVRMYVCTYVRKYMNELACMNGLLVRTARGVVVVPNLALAPALLRGTVALHVPAPPFATVSDYPAWQYAIT
jgi:hypothetical protein